MIYMPEKTKQALEMMLESPWWNWKKACGIAKPKTIFVTRKVRDFIKCVEATKEAIRATLRYEFYPTEHIPRVEAELIDGNWELDVHMWGHPLGSKYNDYSRSVQVYPRDRIGSTT